MVEAIKTYSFIHFVETRLGGHPNPVSTKWIKLFNTVQFNVLRSSSTVVQVSE